MRYTLPLTGSDGSADAVLELPPDALVLDCREQYGRHPCLWVLEALEDPVAVAAGTAPKRVKHKYRLFGTGVHIPDGEADYAYVGSAQVAGGDQVVHVFEDKSPGDADGADIPAPVSPGGGGNSGVVSSPPDQPPEVPMKKHLRSAIAVC